MEAKSFLRACDLDLGDRLRYVCVCNHSIRHSSSREVVNKFASELSSLTRTNDSDPVLNREIVWKAKLMQWLSNNSTPPPIRLAPSFTLGRPEDQQSLRSLGMVATRGSESLAKCLAMNRTLASSLPTITPLTFIFCQTGNTTFTF